MYNEIYLLHVVTTDKKTNLVNISLHSSKISRMFHEISGRGHTQPTEVKHHSPLQAKADKNDSGLVPCLNCHAKSIGRPPLDLKILRP